MEDIEMKYISLILLLIPIIIYSKEIEFTGPVDLGAVDVNYLDEASGLVASSRNRNILWSHNDDPDEKRIYAINTKAEIVAIYYLDIKDLKDIEDISTALGKDGEYYLYLGDIGDNDTKFDSRQILKFKEPYVNENQSLIKDTIEDIDIIEFEYPNKKYDAEAFFVDPATLDIYIITKRLDREKVFLMSYPQDFKKLNSLEHITDIPIGKDIFEGSGVTASDISADGNEILIKNYTSVIYYRIDAGQTIVDAFSNEPLKVNYTMEPQGEAIAWHPKSKGYYTLSELSPLNIIPHLYFYQRVGTGVKKKSKK